MVNLFMVYFFQYVIVTSFANALDHKIKQTSTEHANETEVKHFFVILNLVYRIGVFLSRSSLSLIKIKQLWILTFL